MDNTETNAAANKVDSGQSPPKITQITIPDNMNICFFELWGADSQAMGGRKYKTQDSDTFKGLRDGEDYGAFDSTEYGLTITEWDWGNANYDANSSNTTIMPPPPPAKNSQLNTGRGAYMKGYFLVVPGEKLYIGLGNKY